MPRPTDWVLTLIYIGVLGVHLYFRTMGFCHPKCPIRLTSSALLVAGILALLLLDRVEYWQFGDASPTRIAMLFQLIRMALILIVFAADKYDFSAFLLLFIPFTAFPVFGARISYLLALLCWGSYIYTSEPIFIDKEQTSFFLVYTLGLIFIVTMAHLIHREKVGRVRTEKLLHELEVSHQQLQEKSTRVAELAATEERNRLARNIHDSLGHYLTVINIQLEKALAFRQLSPTEADASVRNAKNLASEALKDIRASVSTLRNGDMAFSLTDELTELVQQVQTEELTVELALEGHEEGFSKQTLLTLYRAVQEGLTNVQKHASATQAKVQIALLPHRAELVIEDNGNGFEPAKLEQPNGVDAHGFGLIGLRERLELLSGTLQLESQPKRGTRLSISAPKDPTALATTTQG